MDSAVATGLHLLLGPPNSGKRGVVLNWWQERLPRRPVVVMPTALDAQDMTAEMARRTGGMVGQSPAVTFAGLAELVSGRRRRLADDFERNLLVCGLLRNTPLEAFPGVKRLPGLTEATAALLLELRGSGKTAEELHALLEQWVSAEPEAAPVASDVGKLLEGYVQLSAHLGLVDQPAAVSEAVRLADGWNRPVAFWGFASFTRGQRVLIERLSQGTQVLVVLTHDPERGVGLCAPEEVEWWAERAGEVSNVQPRSRAYASPTIAYLENSFLGGGHSSAQQEKGEGEEGVHFLLASGRRAEAELAAEHIAGLIREGVDPSSIAVVVRQVQGWAGLLGDVFESCGIPWQVDVRRRLGETGLGHAFLRALQGIALQDAEPLFSFLRSPYSGVDLGEVSGLETRYRRGVERGPEALAALAEGGAEEALQSVWALVPATGRGRGPTDAPALDLTAAITLAEDMLVSGAQRAAVGDRGLEDDAEALRSLRAALSKAAEMTEQNEESLGVKRVRGTDVGLGLSACLRPQVVLHLLARAGVAGPTGSVPGAVQILSAKRARARRFEVVFILGLVEGEFPGDSETPSLLSARQRNSLDQVGGGVFAPPEESEITLFVGAASRAWRSLYLSAREAEDDGGEAVPSRFWQEAKNVLGVGDQSHDRRTLADQVFTPEAAPTIRHYLRACADAGQRAALAAYGGEEWGGTPKWRLVPERLRAPEVLAELESIERFSPSSLEAYVRCPFAWFIERVVGLEEIEYEADRRVLGELIHRALSECYRSLAAGGRLPLKAVDLGGAERTADAIIERLVQGPECPGSSAERRVMGWLLRDMAHRLLRTEAAVGGSLRFAEAERDVGGTDGVDIGGIRVRGRIDRLDATHDERGVFILDYKSGAVPTASALGTGEGLQLPLYLAALAAELEEVEVVGGAYVSLAKGKLAGVVGTGRAGSLGSWPGKCAELDEEEWDQLIRDSRAVALDAAAGMRSGVIVPRSDGPCPDWCKLGPACRSRRRGGRR